MSVTDVVLSIAGSTQWNFVYYVVVLLALGLALGIAYGHWRRGRQAEARRLVVGSAALLITRLIPLIVSPLSGAGVNTAVVLPPLERALDTIALGVIGWMFVLPLSSAWSAPFLWINMGLVVVAGVTLTRLWAQELGANPALFYGLSWQRYMWAGWQIALCLFLGAVALKAQRTARQVGMLLWIFGLVAVGQVLEIGWPIMPWPFAIWERVSYLLVWGILVGGVYGMAIERAGQGDALLALSPNATTITEMLLDLLAEEPASRGEADAGAAPPADSGLLAAGRTVKIVARALGAEQAAIGLLEGDQGDRMRLAAIFNPKRRGRGEVVSFPLDEQMVIRRALRRRELVQADGADDIVQIKFLYALMGSDETGPILIQPLIYRERLLGAIIAGNGTTKVLFGDGAIRLAPLLGELVSFSLAAPRTIDQLEEGVRGREQALAGRETEWSRQLDIVDHELQQERESAQLFGQRLADLEREGQQQQAEAERVTRRLAQQEEETRRSQQEAAALSKKLESLTLAKLVLEDEIRGYRDQIHNLEHLLSEREQALK